MQGIALSQQRTYSNAVSLSLQEEFGLMQKILYLSGIHKIVKNQWRLQNSEYITSNVRRCDYYCGSGCPCVCRDNRLARRGITAATATEYYGNNRLAGRASTAAGPNVIELNQHDDGDPYDSQFDSLRT